METASPRAERAVMVSFRDEGVPSPYYMRGVPG